MEESAGMKSVSQPAVNDVYFPGKPSAVTNGYWNFNLNCLDVMSCPINFSKHVFEACILCNSSYSSSSKPFTRAAKELQDYLLRERGKTDVVIFAVIGEQERREASRPKREAEK